MSAMLPSPFTMPSTARWSALSRCVTMISVTGSRTWPGKPLIQLTYATTPLSYAGFSVKKKMTNPATSKTTPSTKKLESTEQKGDPLIRDLYQNGTDSVHDMRVVNTDAKYHLAKTP